MRDTLLRFEMLSIPIMKDHNFIVIKGWMRTQLKLKGNELILFAIIHGYSQDGVSRCKSSITYIQEALGVSRNTAIQTRNKLIEKGLIVKHGEGSTYEYSSKTELVQKLNYPSAETELVASAETEPNKYITNNTNKNEYVHFDRFWEIYPRRTAKQTARVSWDKLKPDEELFSIISKSIKEHSQTPQWKKDKVIPHAATWINQKRWEDELGIKTTKEPTRINNQDKEASMVEFMKSIKSTN